MNLLSLLFFPVLGAIATLFSGKYAKQIALISSLITLAITLVMLSDFNPEAGRQFTVNYPWITKFGIYFTAGVDGISMSMLLLTTGLLPLIILSTFKRNIEKPVFYALMLFMQFGLLIVFTAMDAFLFYIGWELALIPIYFICALWGAEDRIKVNMKFFIYTIAGSLFMLLAIIYLYLQTPSRTFSIDAFYALNLPKETESWLFWCFFLAFAIKMPIFPFHTWQPDTYTSAPTAGTMLLGGIMLKMGVYGAIVWLVPVLPHGFLLWGKFALTLSVIGVVYGSIIAFTQKDIKRLIAYSSIAHVGLISAGVFTWNLQGLQGAIIQMINHGINVIGLFFVVDILIDRLKKREMAQMGGIAKIAPKLALAFLIVVLGAVGLPLTNGFVGEFLLLNGLFKFNLWYAVFGGLTIIFSAVYMLRAYKFVMQGELNAQTSAFKDISGSEVLVFALIAVLIIIIGVYPNALLHISEASVEGLITKVNNKLHFN